MANRINKIALVLLAISLIPSVAFAQVVTTTREDLVCKSPKQTISNLRGRGNTASKAVVAFANAANKAARTFCAGKTGYVVDQNYSPVGIFRKKTPNVLAAIDLVGSADVCCTLGKASNGGPGSADTNFGTPLGVESYREWFLPEVTLTVGTKSRFYFDVPASPPFLFVDAGSANLGNGGTGKMGLILISPSGKIYGSTSRDSYSYDDNTSGNFEPGRWIIETDLVEGWRTFLISARLWGERLRTN